MARIYQLHTNGFISYVQPQRLIFTGFLDHLSHIRNVLTKAPSVDSIPMAREFPNVFLTNLPRLPPKNDVDFSIDLEPNPTPISIPPYWIVPTELKEISVQL